MKIQHVALASVQQVWPAVEGFITEANKHGGDDYTNEQIRLLVSSGQWLLVVASDAENVVHGVATVMFSNMPNDRIAFVTCIGGRLISDKNTFAQFSALLKVNGATKIQGAAREAIARLWRRYGFTTRHVIVETRI